MDVSFCYYLKGLSFLETDVIWNKNNFLGNTFIFTACLKQHVTESEMELCTNEKHTIAKIYKFLLRFKMEEQFKECMINWAKNFYCNSLMDQWERL